MHVLNILSSKGIYNLLIYQKDEITSSQLYYNEKSHINNNDWKKTLHVCGLCHTRQQITWILVQIKELYCIRALLYVS